MSRITDFLAQRFPENRIAQGHYGELLSTYESSGLAPPNLVEALTSSDDGKFWAHVWEAILYRHLSCLGFTFHGRVTKSGQLGPDFGIVHEEKTIWIEAVTPSPEGIPQNYLEPPKRGEINARTKPHEQMLLRWTSVLKDKRDKLESYVQKKIITATDCTVIAVNSCRLQDFAVDDLGISQLPFAVETVFPIGPIAVPITPDGKLDGDPIRIPRHTIRKPTGVEISTSNFLDQSYRNVSAILGCYRRDMLNGVLPLTVVHNPLAIACLPRGILGATKEYVADDRGDHYLVRPLTETLG
jgi:hypothetical protein